MMIKKILLLSSCILLFACAEEKKTEIPENIISKEKMMDVMLDVQLLEASMTLNVYNADRTETKKIPSTYHVFKKHEITKEQYNESFIFYSENPEQLIEIYQEVLEKLSTIQAEVLNEKETKKDSLNQTDTIVKKSSSLLERMKQNKK